MCIRNRALALAFRLILVAGCLCGLYLISGLSKGAFSPLLLSYYTIQSNLLVLALFVVLAIRTWRDLRNAGVSGTSTCSPHVKGAVMLTITVTLLVYHFMLVPTMFTMHPEYRPFTLQDVLVHYFTPLMALCDWLLFDPKGRFRWFDPLLWLSLPFAYLIFAFVRAQLLSEPFPGGSRYPYFFMDVDQLGWGVAPWLLGLSVGLLALGYLIYGVDRGLGALARRPERTTAGA